MTGCPLFECETIDRTLVVTLLRRLGSLADAGMAAELDRLRAQADRKDIDGVVFDFGRIDYFGSALLETLRRVWESVQARGGRLAVCRLSRLGREIISLARFDQLWAVCDSREEALAAVETKD